jgi:uncharacterized Zn finger protein (UPF0148 family)
MFCPRCGERLTEGNGELTCVAGKMRLSQVMAKGLTECFVERTREPREFQFRSAIGGRWFCTGCGVRMQEVEGRIACPVCDRCLNEFVIGLIERHPHQIQESEDDRDTALPGSE